MKYNFNEIVNRKNTNSLKYDALRERFGRSDILPLWVADMDFRVCPKIVERLQQIIEHGIFGYNIENDDYYFSIINWLKKRHNYLIKKDEIFFTTGVVPAIKYLINCFTNKGDGILIQTPVYYPFMSIIRKSKRKLLINKLIEDKNYYIIDFEDFERKISEAKVFILCNPHNPVGRVWKKDELLKIADICLKYNTLIISDEIHSDIVFENNVHIPIATLSEDIRNITITCNSSSKTFNLASLKTAYIIIHSDNNRNIFKKYIHSYPFEAPNILGLEAMTTAYNNCEDWLNELLDYIYENYQFLTRYIKSELSFIKYSPLEGTYLVWLDFRETGMTDEKLKIHLIEKAKLALNEGYIFGPGGSGFQRINIACPRNLLGQALDNIKNSFL